MTPPALICSSIVLEFVIAGAAAELYRRVRGTTLAEPALWAIAAALSLAVADAWGAFITDASTEIWASFRDYATAVSVFCPIMAVLGAKRPQHRGWQWVVASLWLVLLVPGGQALVASAGSRLELASAWRLLLWALIAIGLLNYLPTRHSVAAALFAVAQALLLSPYLLTIEMTAQFRSVGVWVVASSILAVVISARRRVRGGPSQSPVTTSSLQGLSERWEALRDGWGAFWALRILQRINQTADLSDWPVRLHWWTGLELAESPWEPEVDAHIEQTFDSLLRRFERVA